MVGLTDRVQFVEGNPTLRRGGVPVAEVERRAQSGEGLDLVASSLQIEPHDVFAAFAFLGLGPAGSEGPGLVQSRPDRPWIAEIFSDDALESIIPGASRARRLCVAAGFLQIHDHWDASHDAAQQAEDRGERRLSGYWHGIAHRREPDAGNAAYWFRRVGRDPLFRDLAEAAGPLVGDGADKPDGVHRGGSWDPLAFIGMCAAARPGSPSCRTARRLQRLEMDLLLAESLAGITA
jgi:hypothetical protein